MRAPLRGFALFLGVVSVHGAAFATASPDGSVLAVIERLSRETTPALVTRGVEVVWNGGDFLLAIVDDDGTARLRADGFAARAIDRDPRGASYYLVAPVTPERLTELAGRARIVWSTTGRALVDVPSERLGALLDAGFEIARIPLDPVRLHLDIAPLRVRGASEPLATITELVGAVDGARVDAHVARLAAFGTRYAVTDSAQAAAAYVHDAFISFGIDSVTYHEWNPGVYAPNVVAVIPGITRPDELVVVGGHYDSIAFANPDDAPGADDNASGTALVLECARVLAGESFARTLVFIAFGAEELGLIGSSAWVSQVAIPNDLDIVAMLNADMVGYSQTSELDMTLISEPVYPELRDLMLQVGADYVPTLPLESGVIPAGTSDHASFWQGGYHAIMFFEDSFAPCPFIHTSQDRVDVGYNAPALAHLTTQLGVAFLATLADPARLSIGHDPLADTEETTQPYVVDAQVRSPYPLDPDSLLVRYEVDGTSGEVPLLPTGVSDGFEASIPSQPAGRFVSYYLVAGDTEGGRVTDPSGAPEERHVFFVGTITELFADDFEASTDWRVRLVGDGATSGLWTLADPVGTGLGLGLLVQPEYDHTPGANAVMCYVTGNAAPGAPVGEADVDGGRTSLQSPRMDLSGHTNARLTYYRWFANSAGVTSGTDPWVASVSADDGASWIELERLTESRRTWQKVERELSDYIPLTAEVLLRFVATDEGSEDIVEAALDDVSIRSYQDPVTPTDPGVPGEPPPIPALVRIVPNPYGALDDIRLGVPAPARAVSVRIYDVAGRLVDTLLDARSLTGEVVVRWDGLDTAHRPMPSGRYFVRIRAGSETANAPLLLVR